MTNTKKNINEIVSHLKVNGFVFQGSSIYGGLSNTWDYGHLGVLLKNNIFTQWKNSYVLNELNNYLLDSKILMHPDVWKTSGHVDNFSDPLIENKINNKRYRADKLIAEFDSSINAEAMNFEQMYDYISQNITTYDKSKCEWLPIRKFNLMFETKQGVVENQKSLIYLRPETAQGIFINFKNMQRTMRAKLPMGIGQMGKSFRNEVTPGNFIFRTREFEQLELEVFCEPEQAQDLFNHYLNKANDFLLSIGLNKESIRFRKHDKEELAHYSLATTDIEFLFPFGWGELLGVANRSDFDLKSHMAATNEDLTYLNLNNEKIIPYVIEPSMGLDRLMLAIICDAYTHDEKEDRVVLKLNKKIAPYKIAVLPLVKKLSEKANTVYKSLIEANVSATYDETGSIGKRYRRQDAVGTYWCATIDYDTLEDECVTIRNRDTMEQERIKIDEILNFI